MKRLTIILDLFLAEAHDLVECKDVEEFITKINANDNKL